MPTHNRLTLILQAAVRISAFNTDSKSPIIILQAAIVNLFTFQPFRNPHEIFFSTAPDWKAYLQMQTINIYDSSKDPAADALLFFAFFVAEEEAAAMWHGRSDRQVRHPS